MEDDSWVAADSRAGEARRASLQAKKEEQPATKRSYIAKQKEWRGPVPELMALHIAGPMRSWLCLTN
jgi:hypothetical protein